MIHLAGQALKVRPRSKAISTTTVVVPVSPDSAIRFAARSAIF